MKQKSILKKIDNLFGYYEKLEYLNGLFLKAKTNKDETMILEMIEQLKFYGK